MSSRATRRFGAIRPSDYLALAEEWARIGDGALLRSAVDRAYYAAFLTARDELTGKGYGTFSGGPQAHSQVAVTLSGIKDDVGQRLVILRRARNLLNYQTGSVVLPRGQSLPRLFALSGSVIEAVQNLPVIR